MTNMPDTEIGITQVYDYSGDLNPRTTVLFPWLNPVKLTDPTLPAGIVNMPAWSPNGEFLAVVHQTTPFVTIYQRSGKTFTKLGGPVDLPASTGYGAGWSPNGEFLAVGHQTTPFITIYQRSGTTFTKLANPATLPASSVWGVVWSPNGEFLAAGVDANPFVTIYQTSGTLLEKGIARIEKVIREGD